jgi:DHA1 family tetracycline resistance protein-like MFS transporter
MYLARSMATLAQGKKPAILFILITALIDSISIGIIIPVFPKLIMSMEQCDESRAAVIGGWLMFWFAVMQFVMSPILGSLSDRFGRRPVLLLSLFGFGIDFLLLAFAPTLSRLFAGRIMAGIMGASYTTAAAYIADISNDDTRSKHFGMLGAAFGMGFIIGPGIGGLLAQWGVRVPFIACAILSLVNWLYGYFILPESLPQEHRRPFDWKRANPIGAFLNISKHRSILGYLACFFLLYLGAQAVMTNWQYYTMLKFQWTEKAIGVSIMTVGIIVAFVQGVLVRVVNSRIGNTNAMLIGLTLYIIGMAGFGLAPTGTFMMLAIIPYCLGGINGPAIQSLMTESVPSNAQGELQGLITSVQSITSIIGPLMMAGIFSHFTGKSTIYFPGAAFITAAFLILLALVIAWFTIKSKKISS